MSEAERWAKIPGWPYEVSDRGRVRRDGRMRKLHTTDRGYKRVCLYDHGRSLTTGAHRLVLMAFVGPCPEGCEADHINENPSDNRLENLRWLSSLENTRRAANLSKRIAREMRERFAEGGITKTALGEEYDMHRTHVGNVLRGEIWRDAGGPIEGEDYGRPGPYGIVIPDETVEAVRLTYANTDMSHRAVAEKYGLSEAMVGYLVNGERRADAPGPIKGEDYE